MICRTNRVGSPLIVLAFVCLAGGVGGGCASQGEKMVQSFAKTREQVTDAQRHVDATLVGLQRLRSTPPEGLTKGYRTYKDAVEELEEEAADAGERSAMMRQESEQHIKAWQKEVETLKDPTIKATMDARRQAVRSNYQLVTMYAQDARKAYEPYVAGNKELVRALSIDLSPASIAGLSPSIDRVLLDGKALQEKLFMLQNALNNIAAGVSPLGEMK
jgi:hypothetical protein